MMQYMYIYIIEVIIVLFVLQVVIAVSQVMWCRDLTNCLTDDEDVLSAIKGAEQRCFQVTVLHVSPRAYKEKPLVSQYMYVRAMSRM